MTETSSPPAADWYPDPGGPPSRLRWWDGVRWSGWVAVDGQVLASPVPRPGGVGHSRSGVDPVDTRMELGAKALGITIATIVWSLALTVGTSVVAIALGFDTDAQLLAASGIGLYTGLVLGCVVVQRQHGTPGRFRQDFGLEVGKGDWWRGGVASLAARGGGGVLAVIIAMALGDVLEGREIDQLPTSGGSDPTAALLLTFAVVAVVVAPVVEELFFRGLLMRSLEGVLPDWAALLVQGVVFGLAHLSFAAGIVNLLVVVPIGFAGLAFGWLAQRYRRLGPGIWGHVWFNVFATIAMLVIISVD